MALPSQMLQSTRPILSQQIVTSTMLYRNEGQFYHKEHIQCQAETLGNLGDVVKLFVKLDTETRMLNQVRTPQCETRVCIQDS